MRPLIPTLALATLLIFASLASAAATPKVDLTGTVETGIMAIGGETTGVTLKTDAGTYELTGATPDITKQIADLNGKKAHVFGTLTVKEGVETGARKIVTVDTIEAAK